MRIAWLVVLGVAVCVVVGLGWQRRVLRHRVEALRSAMWSPEPAREVGAPAASAVVGDQSAGGNDASVLAALRSEFEALKNRVEAQARSRQLVSREAHRLSHMQGAVAAEWWSDAGQDTPAATLESALWAAAGGDLTRLARTLTIEPGYRDKATALLSLLPEEFHGRFATAEDLVAFLMIKDVPLGSAEILQQLETVAGTRLSVRLVDAEGRRKTAVLTLKQSGPTWRLVVPADAIERYASYLQGEQP